VQPVFADLARHQILLGDLDFLVLGVPAQVNDFHPVEQRDRDGFKRIGRRDEHHLRQVERHVDIVIAELEVLLRIEHFQQGGRRIAPEVAPQLVHLIQHDHRVAALNPAQRLDQAARHGADVGPPEAANLGLVADAAQRHASEAAAHRAGDGRAQRGLAYAGRTHKAQDDAFALAADVVDMAVVGRQLVGAFLPQLADRQVLQDALLDVFQAVVVLVQHGARVLDIEVIFGGDVPRQADHPIEIGPDHAIFRRRRGQPGEAIELAAGFALGLFRHAGLVDFAAELLNFDSLFVAFT